MAATLKYPREWLERVPAVVFACLLPGELRIVVHPGVGIADGSIPWNVPVDLIPPELRMPNVPLGLELDERMNILDATSDGLPETAYHAGQERDNEATD